MVDIKKEVRRPEEELEARGKVTILGKLTEALEVGSTIRWMQETLRNQNKAV